MRRVGTKGRRRRTEDGQRTGFTPNGEPLNGGVRKAGSDFDLEGGHFKGANLKDLV